MILTEEEITEVIDQGNSVEGNRYLPFAYARAIEAAIIKKLGSPVAYEHLEEGLSYENHYIGNIPLYKLPE